jgi:uncharacterized protein (DUF362 family)
MNKKSKPRVSIVSSSKPGDAGKAIELIGGFKVRGGEKVLVKPNLSFPFEVTGATNTKAETVEEVVKALLREGAKPIIGEGAAYPYSSKIAFKSSGMIRLAKKYGVPLVNLNKDKIEIIKLKNPLILKEVHLARTVVECTTIISVAKLKCHFYPIVTLGLKNMVGVLPGIYKHQLHHKFKPGYSWGKAISQYFEDLFSMRRDRERLNRAVVDLCTIAAPTYTLVDGTTALEGAGPTFGRCINANLILAGNDPVATDVVAAYLMGYEPEQIPIIRYAYQIGLGEIDLNKIELVGGNPQELRMHFRDNTLLDQLFDWFQHLLSVPFIRLSHHLMEKTVYLR